VCVTATEFKVDDKMESPSAVLKAPYPSGGLAYGNRLLPHVVEEEAVRDPARIVGILAKSTSPLSLAQITISQLSRAIDFTAWWLDSRLGPSKPNAFEAIAYVGLQDFRYWVMEIAGIKTGHPILLFSPRNAVANNVSLFTSCICKTLIYSEGFEAFVEQQKAALPSLITLKIPTSDELFDILNAQKKVKPYSYTKSWEQAYADPAIILHTSGSTGPPKPIPMNHAAIGILDSMRLIPPINGRKAANPSLLAGKVTFVGAPMFHLGGFAFSIQLVFSDSTALLGPVGKLASAEVLSGLMRETKVQALFGTPALLENLVKDHVHELKDLCKDLELVLYTGGPLSQAAGDAIVQNTKAELSQNYGTTEVGNCHILMPEREHWSDFNWHPTYGPDLDLVDEEAGLYELVVRRREDQLWGQCVFYIFPELTEWRTKDLFKRKQGGTWVYQGRTDDVINLKGPGKVNPLILEGKLQSLPSISGAVVFGNGRLKCGLIVEVFDGHNQVSELVLEVVEKENGNLPAHARIERGMVMSWTKEKPFVRAGKGTIVRAQTLREHETEIEELYRKD
jgi:acyl-coenzyme A synthetase/AMP-(fatty) acid ligase